MRKVIFISFNGRNFAGTQKQKEDLTIQGLFEDLLSSLYAKKIKVNICSRLDKKVNALDFALSFDTDSDRFSNSHIKYYLSRMCDSDILIKEIRDVKDDFSVRYDCDYKIYLYLIQNKTDYNPLYNSIAYPSAKKLDVEKLKEALNLFKGKHDFKYFSSPEGDENTILSLDDCYLEEKNDFIYIRFKGKSFLRYQVRFMVGALLRYTQNKLTLEQIKKLLNGENIKYLKLKAEPYALTLEKINYPIFEKSI